MICEGSKVKIMVLDMNFLLVLLNHKVEFTRCMMREMIANMIIETMYANTISIGMSTCS